MKADIPAVSIIIPMYNAEKYIAECLDSILAQTFDDYEVIVVDDASTDKSRDIVTSYLPKFQREGVERLNLICSEKNSRSGAEPRNIGLRLSRGEYVLLIDNDDAILENALESLYNTAEKFGADVVHCDQRYPVLTEHFTEYKNQLNLLLKNNPKSENESKTTNLDLEERLKMFFAGKMHWEPWTNLIKRDLLMVNNLEFPRLSIADDLAFMSVLICISKNFFVTQKPFYIWRQRADSNGRSSSSAEITIHKRGGDVFRGLKFFEEFSNNLDFFQKNPAYKYMMFDSLTRKPLLISLYAQIPAHLLDDLVRREIAEIGDTTAITAFLFARMNVLNAQLIKAADVMNQQQNKIAELQKQFETKLNTTAQI